MVVLPRHARRRGANPYGNPHHSSYSPSPPIHHGGHGNGTYHPPSPRFSQQSIILILAGMGLGYMITINMGSSSNQLAANGNLDAIVKNLEKQRAAAAAASSQKFGTSGDNINTNMNMGGSSSSGAGAVVDNGLSSPMNMMNNQHREAAALLRGDASSNHHAMHNHRILSTPSADVEQQAVGDYAEGEEEVGGDVSVHSEPEDEEASAVSERYDISAEEEEGGAVVVESERRDSEVRPLAVNQQHHTFTDQDVIEDLTEAQQRFIETQKLIASQSIPTPTNPHVMKTVSFDHMMCEDCIYFCFLSLRTNCPLIFTNCPILSISAQPNLPDSKRKKILITGGAGFVGSHLTDKLMMEGHEVIVMDNFFTGQRKNVAHWMHHPRFSLVVHDVTEPIMLEVDEIYHLACPASPPHYQYNPVKTIKVRIYIERCVHHA